MGKRSIFWLAAVFLWLAFPVLCLAKSDLASRQFPGSQGFVNDFAGLMSRDARISLEQKLNGFEKNTGAEIAVVTIDSLEGDTIENTAVDLFAQWGIGKKDKDNGVLLLIAKNEREVRIEVGYGLEPLINDAAAGRIIREQITPAFKQSSYDKGINDAVDKIMSLASKEVGTSQTSETKSSESPGIGFIIGTIFVVQWLFSFLARSKSFYLGGILGGLGGILIGLLSGSLVGGIFLGIIMGLIGLFIDWILSRNYRAARNNGRTPWWFRGGSSGGRSGGLGGGFGGFGGGSSGGGGASGKW